MLSGTLVRTLHAALALAAARRHEYATLEHLLLALLDDADAAAALRACRVDLDKLRVGLTGFIDEDLAGLVAERAGDPRPTTGFRRAVWRATSRVQGAGRDEMTGADVLAALFSAPESHAAYFLQLHDVTEGAIAAAAGPRSAAARVFVALPPGPGTAEAWARGFAPAIRAAGHRADPAGLTHGVARPDLDRILQSRLVVVDLTHADGALHYAAGFAAGLGVPVVPTRRADRAPGPRPDDDARYPDVLAWRTPEELAAGLEERIVAVLGRGPGEATGAGGDADGALLDAMTAALKRLIARGKERGYVTYDEINAVLPQGQVSSELIEDTLAMLGEIGITAVEAEEGEEGPAEP